MEDYNPRIEDNAYNDPTATYDEPDYSRRASSPFTDYNSTQTADTTVDSLYSSQPQNSNYNPSPSYNDGFTAPQQPGYASTQPQSAYQTYGSAPAPQPQQSGYYGQSYGQPAPVAYQTPTPAYNAPAPAPVAPQPQYNQGPAPAPYAPQPAPNVYPKSKGVAVILGFFLGSLGAHNFYLGYYGKGIAQLLLTLIGWMFFFIGPAVAGIWAIVEIIQILVATPGSLHNKDARGVDMVWWN